MFVPTYSETTTHSQHGLFFQEYSAFTKFSGEYPANLVPEDIGACIEVSAPNVCVPLMGFLRRCS